MGDLTTTDNVKKYLGIETDSQDALLTLLISGASAKMQKWVARDFGNVKHESERVASNGFEYILLKFGPVIEVLSVSEIFSTLAATDYIIEQPRSLVRTNSAGFRIAWSVGEIKVTYKSGFEKTPADIVLAATMQSAYEYKQTQSGDSRLGLKSNAASPGESVSFETGGLLDSVKETLTPYKRLF